MTKDAICQLGVVVVVLHEGRYLVIKRAANVIAPGTWCFVGGAIEPGETQQDAIVREFREEVGGKVRPVRLIWEYTRPDGQLHLYWWLVELEPGPLQVNPEEVAEIRWCTPAEIDALPDVLPSNREFLRTVGTDLIRTDNSSRD